MKKENYLGKKEFFDFLGYIDLALDFDIGQVEQEEYEDIAMLLISDDISHEEVLQKMESFYRVVFVQLYLAQNDFIHTVTELVPGLKSEMLKAEDLTFDIALNGTMYVISLIKVKVLYSRKTVIELEEELSVAVKNEDYRTAAKYRDLILRRNKVKKNKK